MRARFSNYGKLVNVFAPGVDPLSRRGPDNSYVYDRSRDVVFLSAGGRRGRFGENQVSRYDSGRAARAQVRLIERKHGRGEPSIGRRAGPRVRKRAGGHPGANLTCRAREALEIGPTDDGNREIASGDTR